MIIFFKFFLFFVFFSLQSLTAFSQSVIGSAYVNGDVIEIMSDKTWRYKSEVNQNLRSKKKPQDCDFLKYGIYFCNKSSWQVSAPTGSFTNLYVIDDKTYAGFIIEEIGSNDGVTREFMTKLALDNAASAANVSTNQIVQHFVEEQSIDDISFTTVAYSAAVEGMSFIFLNNIYVNETVTAQAIVYGFGSSVNSRLLSLNKELINNLSFSN